MFLKKILKKWLTLKNTSRTKCHGDFPERDVEVDENKTEHFVLWCCTKKSDYHKNDSNKQIVESYPMIPI